MGSSIVEGKLPAVIALCKKYRVGRLALFGSGLTSQFDPQSSDVDFLVNFRPMSPAEHAGEYFGLLEDLESMFGLPVDLVESKAIRNPYVREQIEAYHEVLFADD